VLRATGLAFAPAPLVVTAADPEDGALLSAYPAVYRVVFSEPILLTSLDPEDLTVDGVPADSLTLIDARTVDFTIASADTGDGLYHVEIAAGAITSLSGQPLEAFSATFDYDATNPTVIASSIWEGDVVPPGTLVYQVQFSEELATAGLGAEDVTLVDSISGASVAANAFVYDSGHQHGDGDVQQPARGQLHADAVDFGDRLPRPARQSAGRIAQFPAALGRRHSGRSVRGQFPGGPHDGRFPRAVGIGGPGGRFDSSGSVTGVLNATGDVDAFTIDVDPGQTVSLVLVPQSGNPQARLELFAPDGTSLGSADASVAGQTVYLQTLPAADAGTYRIEVSSLAGAGAFDLKLALNAALEEEALSGSSNNDLAGAQDLAAAWIEVGNGSQRAAVLGTADGAGGTADVYRVDLDAGDVLTWLLTGLAGNQPTFEVLDGSGTVLALSAGGTVGAGQSVTEFVVPDSGAYYARIAGSGDYSLLVVRNTGFELADQVYFTDFQTGAGPEWSTTATDNSVAAFTRFLGRFSNGSTTLTLPTVPGRAYVVEFDLMIIDSWDGNSSPGPDYFNVDIAGTRVFRHTFTTFGREPDVPPHAGRQRAELRLERLERCDLPRDLDPLHRLRHQHGHPFLRRRPAGIERRIVGHRQRACGNAGHRPDGPRAGALRTGVDQYQFTAEEGNQLTIHTTTPGDGPGQPVNTFDAYLQLYGPEGLLVALDDDSGPQNDGRNAQILYTVPEGPGERIRCACRAPEPGRIRSTSRARRATVSPLPEVVATAPVEGQRFAAPPASLELTFSQWLRVDTLDAAT
jgi:hypothetical protein